MSTNTLRRLLAPTILAGAVAVTALSHASAAAPDGSGPWSDAVSAVQQGGTSRGGKVAEARSNPLAALGAAEDSATASTFFSMGIGGRIALRFDNPFCNGPGADLTLREATTEPYPDERIDVYASVDGTTLVPVAKGANKDVDLDLPASMTQARFLVLVDATDPALFDAADGYDLDGARALHASGCDVPPVASGGGDASGGDTGASTGAGTSGSSGSGGTAPSGTSSGTSDDGASRGTPAALALLQKAPGAAKATCVVSRKLARHSVAAARKSLKKSRCRAVKKVVKRFSTVKVGRVVTTLPKPGSRRPFNAKVTIVVSKGLRKR